MEYHLAIDMGASKIRGILGSVKGQQLFIETVYEQDNHLMNCGGHLAWDVNSLYRGIIAILQNCSESGKIPASIGIDSWAVDFVLLDENDNILGAPVSYRDKRTVGMRELVESRIPFKELYARTGIQYQTFNTIYQLQAVKKNDTEQLQKAKSFLMLPDYFNYLLTGNKLQEYTNATSTGMINAKSREWDKEIITKMDFPAHLFTKLSMPGTIVGDLKREIADKIGFQTKVILPATHDTASAFLAAPSVENGGMILSSGTWSLLGIENSDPITSECSMRANFTNEGGAFGNYRYLKNIMGLWMIQSVRRELNGVSYIEGDEPSAKNAIHEWTYPELSAEAEKEKNFHSEIRVNDERFLNPESMIREVQNACRESGQEIPHNVGQIIQCLYRSLTKSYKNTISEIEEITKKSFNTINIIGGGCQDSYLNKMIAGMCGMNVLAGPVEGSAIGNLVMQMISSGEFAGLKDAKESIRNSFHIQKY